MTIPTAAEILDLLKQAKPRPTYEAPRNARGIYGLFDHTGMFRYIGSTSSVSQTFHERIHERHRTGSETHSHYFAHMYNTGRMWVDRTDPEMDERVKKSVRRLRQAFIARHCGCTWVPLPDHADIAALETQVIALAPPEMVAWNRRGMAVYDEPVDLVDALIAELRLSPVERAALGRQQQRQFGATYTAPATGPDQVGLPPLPEGPFRFFALDVETANHDRGSICQIGVACVRPDNHIVTWVTLIDPRTETWKFSYLHGITRAMVQGAPTIDTVMEALDTMLAGRIVYQHSSFDRSAIRAACAGLNRAEPDWAWQNSVSVASAAWPELKGNGGYGLASLKQHLGLRFEHHDAGEDARAAAEVVLLAERGARISLDPRSWPEPEYEDVLDHCDTGPLVPSHRGWDGAIEPTLHPVKQTGRSPSATADSEPSTFTGVMAGVIRVPVAADGSCFGPDLVRNGRFTVGAKGSEEQYDSFAAALAALNRMDKPRWRRPNAAGNWGIVSGQSWKNIEKSPS